MQKLTVVRMLMCSWYLVCHQGGIRLPLTAVPRLERLRALLMTEKVRTTATADWKKIAVCRNFEQNRAFVGTSLMESAWAQNQNRFAHLRISAI